MWLEIILTDSPAHFIDFEEYGFFTVVSIINLFIFPGCEFSIVEIILKIISFTIDSEGTHDVEEYISFFLDFLIWILIDIETVIFCWAEFVVVVGEVDGEEVGFAFVLLFDCFELLSCATLFRKASDKSWKKEVVFFVFVKSLKNTHLAAVKNGNYPDRVFTSVISRF